LSAALAHEKTNVNPDVLVKITRGRLPEALTRPTILRLIPTIPSPRSQLTIDHSQLTISPALPTQQQNRYLILTTTAMAGQLALKNQWQPIFCLITSENP
jgi:hypothetical protein